MKPLRFVPDNTDIGFMKVARPGFYGVHCRCAGIDRAVLHDQPELRHRLYRRHRGAGAADA